MRQYRVIYDHPTTGKRNMAIDEAIMNAVATRNSPPTLRFYAWSPPCLSLGYNQPINDADLERIHDSGWEMVRRATGGRAILHTDELTYSLALPADHPLAEGDIVSSYRRISRALMAGLERLGLRARADQKQDNARHTGPVCFEVPSHYEITVSGGRKLIGSAQVRRRGGVLQHGSLPLHGDVTRICDALTYPDEIHRSTAKDIVRQRAATLRDALGQIITWADAADAITAGFVETFDAALIPGGLTDDEIRHADSLEANVYGHHDWLNRV